ncbi:MAG: SDR family oxidoreductase [Bosea sp.]|nr:SDR family oxidoreductase [Bosea sp. (in: a-proteobacteria)]
MRIDLEGRRVAIGGVRHALADAAAAALAENCATVAFGVEREADLLIIAHPLDLDAAYRPDELIALADWTADAMIERGGGRIIHIVPAVAVLPMRRHAAAGPALAAVIAAMRGLAMRAAPTVLVNALATGWIEAGASGDAAMGTHVPLGRPGRIEEAVPGLLFLADPMNTYTTGQVLTVDGGWTAGYGRDF